MPTAMQCCFFVQIYNR